MAGEAAAQARGPEVEELVVTGSRVSEAKVAIGTDEPTATVSITSDALLSAPAGITGLKMLESLPGFNVQANDALGMYEFGNSVSVRAFNFQQIGFLLDDVPMGRSDQFGGSPIYRYVDNENLARVTASSGAGDVALASYASLGPIVSYISRGPAETFGGRVSYSRGSDELLRAFGRIDTGEHNGFSAFVSASTVSGELWRGPGTIDRDHYEGQARYRWSTGGSLTFQTVHNKYFDYDSPSITKAQYAGTAGDIFGRSGREFAYIGYVPVPGAAGTPATATSLPITTAGIPYSNTAYNQYYKFAVNSREDHLYALTLKTPIGENVDVSVTGYYEDKKGYGVSPEAYATSLASHNAERLIVPGLFAPRGIQYGLSTIDGKRKGLTGNAVWRWTIHTVQAGAWYEDDDYHRTQQRYNVANGNPDGAPLLNEPVHLQRNYTSNRKTTQIFLKDTISLLDGQLKVDVGFKGLDIDYEISGYRNPGDFINRRTPTITDKWKDLFLPQVGAVWSVTSRDQVFVSYSENMALPRGADDIFSAASPLAPGPDAEKAKNYELGVRTNRPTFNASLVAYFTKFDNRLQSFASPVPGSTTTETFFQNVGSVEAHGAEFSGQWKPEFLGGKVYFNTNLSYNISEFKDNFATFAITGNRVPDFPKWLFQGGVTFEPTPGAILNLSARTISKRYTNFLNTETTGGYTILAAYLDLGDGVDWGYLKNVKARINVDNLLDEDYLGTISTTINTPASFRPGPRRTVQVTLSTEF
ncbi:TonB-dependent receptor [Phenylobacterium sp.]|uniref:TonB-dependent receptor n=1 Tax=Phenylobacterium sp. TaxID=1871053 RepID=UPI0025F99FE0|nr:TonB-dependent receptor [Phenylobacterium sp.]